MGRPYSGFDVQKALMTSMLQMRKSRPSWDFFKAPELALALVPSRPCIQASSRVVRAGGSFLLAIPPLLGCLNPYFLALMLNLLCKSTLYPRLQTLAAGPQASHLPLRLRGQEARRRLPLSPPPARSPQLTRGETGWKMLVSNWGLKADYSHTQLNWCISTFSVGTFPF